MEKFYKVWKMFFTTGDITTGGQFIPKNQFTISYPLTCDFNVNKNFSSYTNTAVFTIYGLSEEVRNKLYHNQLIDRDKFIFVEFVAGYGNELYTVFKGRVIEGYSGRKGGETEFKTYLTCSSFWQAIMEKVVGTYQSGTFKDVIISDIGKRFYGISFDKSFDVMKNWPLTKGYSFSCSAREVIQDLTHGNYYENDGIIYLLDAKMDDVPVLKVSNSTVGLLGTPIRQKQSVRITTLFEPQITMGSVILLESETQKQVNELYKVMEVHHKGVISGGTESNATTEMCLYTSFALSTQRVDNEVQQ